MSSRCACMAQAIVCLLAAALLGACSGVPRAPAAMAASTAQPAADALETRKAHALFDAYWDETARMYPEWASYRGDHRFGDRLLDASPAAIEERKAWWRELQQRVRRIDAGRLSTTDRVSLQMLGHTADINVLMQQFEAYQAMSVNGGVDSFHGALADLLRVMPVATIADVERLLARMAAYPLRVEQEIARLEFAQRAGMVPPRAGLERALAQIDSLLAAPLASSPYFEPFTRLGSAIPEDGKKALRERGERAVLTEVLPAMRRLRDFVGGAYLAAAPADGALLNYRDGQRIYAALVRNHTTTSLTPAEIHQIGLQQVARLRGEMEAIQRSTGFDGDFAAFVRFLNSDPKFFYGNGDELLAGYRDIAKRIDPELPKLFAELPRAPYGIRAAQAMGQTEGPETYSGPSLDGSRPGWFNANILRYKTRTKWEMETLIAHETVPGHHLQAARAVELKQLPAFRRGAFHTAYIEGWGLYAETLGGELGLYKDPYSRFGHLQAQIWRAARLVVDTGIHAEGWSRQRAIDYMVDRTGMGAERVASEVDRYTAWPAQALSYMIGQLKLIELRDRAKAALGDRFDIRRFHMVLLDQGPMPLDVLDSQVEAWIAASR
ncbi:DUF885 domain-containing protein [Piscinibacter sakaiensis]|uniref:DUF885 domain-containing protein n=1 Tax=Piscinibacter sakaiensis TaxID=1547922 RepID=UPI003AAFABAB